VLPLLIRVGASLQILEWITSDDLGTAGGFEKLPRPFNRSANGGDGILLLEEHYPIVGI
jgi:hypothetical protein